MWPLGRQGHGGRKSNRNTKPYISMRPGDRATIASNLFPTNLVTFYQKVVSFLTSCFVKKVIWAGILKPLKALG
jgi:hypothetical protein